MIACHGKAIGTAQRLQILLLLIHQRSVGAGHQGRYDLVKGDEVTCRCIGAAVRVTTSRTARFAREIKVQGDNAAWHDRAGCPIRANIA